MSTNHDVKSVSPLLPQKRYFTVADANAALPYVSRIVKDIRNSYRKALHLQQRIEFITPGEELSALQNEYERIIEMLNRCVEELHKMGVELKDYSLGLIDFPGLLDGREISICWRDGEEEIVAWHEVEAGFAGRQDIEILKKEEK